MEAQRMVERLFLVPRLVSPAWHLCLRVSKVCVSDVWRIHGGPENSGEAVPRSSPVKVSKGCGADEWGISAAQRMVETLFLVPRLVSPAWHLCLKVNKVCGSDVTNDCVHLFTTGGARAGSAGTTGR
jgi:hypothetical protein